MNTRGSCPSLFAPMQTGDGLLARLVLHQPVSLDKFSALCGAAEEYGNGIIEVTQRGSLQIRGLTETSAPRFASVVAALRISAEAGPPLLVSPLVGLDPGEPFDSTLLVSSLLSTFQHLGTHLRSLGPKVSVLIDGGGALHLDALTADIRLVAVHNLLFQLSLAGTAKDASPVGYLPLERAPAAIAKLLQMLADRGPSTRAKDLAQELGLDALRKSLESELEQEPSAPARTASVPSNPLSTHVLKNGARALGFALPFGHTTASVLSRVVEAAAENGATSIRPTPGRAVVAIGLSPSAAEKFREFVASENFLVDEHDPRRHVIACAGAPACASAQLSTRQLAPEVARVTHTWAGTSKIVHLAGCSKGCAHPGVATLTIVGPNNVIVNGRASQVAALPGISAPALDRAASEAQLIAEVARLSAHL